MRYRRFGKTDLTVSELGFGCARIGGFFQDSTRKETLSLLRRALDEGITFFDTADMYTQGESERLLGDAFERDRHRVVIATKFGYVLPRQKRLSSRIKPLLKPLITRLRLKARQVHSRLRGSVSSQDFSPEYISRAIEDSLRRLKTDYIDIYQLHSPPLEILQQGEFVEPLLRMQREGKLRCWGVACEAADDVLAALEYQSVASIQVGFSALEQAVLDAALPRAAEHGAGVIARQAFASGLLTRPVASIEPNHIDSDPVVAERKRAQIAAFTSIANENDRTPGELALKFVLDRPEVSVVPLGISHRLHLESALVSLRAPALSPRESQQLLASRRLGR